MEILEYPNEVLTSPCDTCTLDPNDVLTKLDQVLWNERTGSYLGAGLAANQIGLIERVAIIRINGLKLDLVNPHIIRKSEERLGSTEGCLSLPGRTYTVMRYKNIVVETDNYTEPLIINNFDISRTIQHEIDHLTGKLLIDYLKVGRNDLCPCGSEKKYKKCCGKQQWASQ